MKKTIFIFLLPLFIGFQQANAQESIESLSNEELTKIVLGLDSLLFQEAFNHCNIILFDQLVDEDLEFYDDRSGLNTSKEVEIRSFKDRCGENNQTRIKRVLLQSEVFRLNGFGAVQTGEHGFYLPGTEPSELVEKAKFIIIWAYHGQGKWTMKRTVSYEHQAVH